MACLDTFIYSFTIYIIKIKSDMKTAQKIVNNLINENIFPFNKG